eukprot:gnl/MRDRNA2_/MRDRNA2_97264_c0_seq1.p1 gnl/MRDRNA2_/MRDRNA2_97264_c0~~gnl/MRDRNA2_/MRDRNA2_97264_c0_seq1.p1  ORF type:complete len:157 (+),score=40.57 gnl/MRDRNA2_/MRDRNA2_97264_c0_seq1:89-559(+)
MKVSGKQWFAFSCFKMNPTDTSSTNPKKPRKDSKDSTASTADSATVSRRLSSSWIDADSEKPLERIPDIRKEREWFNYWDVHGLGMLSKLEATAAIQKTFLSFNPEKLSCIIDALWPEFDQDGMIGLDGMLRKQTGLVDASLQTYQMALASRVCAI